MTREEMWKEFENQLIRETRTPITISYDVSEKMIKSAIETTVAKWKERLERELSNSGNPNKSEIPTGSTTKNSLGIDCISRKSVIAIIQNHWWNCRDIDKLVNELPSVTSQEPILDKIRAEIIEEMLSHSGTGEETIQAYADGLKKGLDILDKYKAESEVEDGNDIHIR